MQALPFFFFLMPDFPALVHWLRQLDTPTILTLAAAPAVGALFGLLFGWLATRLRAQRKLTALLLENERLRSTVRSQEGQREQFRQLATDALAQQGATMRAQAEDSLDALLTPLFERLQALEHALRHSNVQRAENRASLEATIRSLMEQAQGISTEARMLTRALKGDSKVQGDWGETILTRMLEAAGLRPGEEYQPQVDIRLPDGSHLRPDMLILLPEGRRLVIDSKVSLTAYTRAVEAGDNAAARAAALREHVQSVRKHVEELAARNYARQVEGSLDVVLMFIPNEASYMAAMQQAAELTQEALRRGILIVSPTTLLMALQVARHLWARERQSRNVQNIIEQAGKLYDQFALFTETFARLGRHLTQTQQAYDDTLRQLTTGKGNLARRFEQLRDLGVTPTRQPALPAEEERYAPSRRCSQSGGRTPPAESP